MEKILQPTYTSCIKINGNPILPPLLTNEYRSNIMRWKQQAVCKENELKAKLVAKQTTDEPVPYVHIEPEKSPDSSTDKQMQFLSPPSRNENNIDNSMDAATPRLIRSNSYTLETPSPILLDFLKKMPNFSLDTSSNTEEVTMKRSSINSLEIVTTIQCNILPNQTNDTIVQTHSFEEALDNSSPEVQRNVPFTLTPTPSCSLLPVETDSTELEKLLNKQKEEQKLLLDSFGKLKSVLLEQIASPSDEEVQHNGTVIKNSDKEIAEIYSPCIKCSTPALTPDVSSQTLYYTFESSETDTIPSKQLLIDFDEHYTISDDNLNCNYIEEIKNDRNNIVKNENEFAEDGDEDVIRFTPSRKSQNSFYNSNRQLFVENNSGLHSPAEQEWAASKITAAAKGYLTRRLLRTEKVQNLIQTIKDSLLCAMQLHKEFSEHIEPADVELHRRLTQQVAAACYAFHEVFFELTTREQMSIIFMDREHLKEKLLRRQKIA